MVGTSFTFDVSNWPTPLRKELLDVVDEFNTRANQAGITNTAAAPVLPEEVEPSGWNKAAYQDVIAKLLNRHHVQVAVIFEAIKNGTGYVSRDRVYEIGNYPENRSLKGFTRPVNRLTSEAVEAGLLPEDADDLLAPDYDPNVTGFQRARGFIVPAEVVKMALEWRDQAEAERKKAGEGSPA